MTEYKDVVDFRERLPGCTVPFIDHGYKRRYEHEVPVCMGGTAVNGCVHAETCIPKLPQGENWIQKPIMDSGLPHMVVDVELVPKEVVATAEVDASSIEVLGPNPDETFAMPMSEPPEWVKLKVAERMAQIDSDQGIQ